MVNVLYGAPKTCQLFLNVGGFATLPTLEKFLQAPMALLHAFTSCFQLQANYKIQVWASKAKPTETNIAYLYEPKR